MRPPHSLHSSSASASVTTPVPPRAAGAHTSKEMNGNALPCFLILNVVMQYHSTRAGLRVSWKNQWERASEHLVGRVEYGRLYTSAQVPTSLKSHLYSTLQLYPRGPERSPDQCLPSWEWEKRLFNSPPSDRQKHARLRSSDLRTSLGLFETHHTATDR